MDYTDKYQQIKILTIVSSLFMYEQGTWFLFLQKYLITWYYLVKIEFQKKSISLQYIITRNYLVRTRFQKKVYYYTILLPELKNNILIERKYKLIFPNNNDFSK